MEKNKVLAVVYLKPDGGPADLVKTVQALNPFVDRIEVAYSRDRYSTVDSLAANNPKLVGYPDQLPAELLNDINAPRMDLVADYYDVVFYVIAGFPIKMEMLPTVIVEARKGTVLQVFRDHPGAASTINDSQEWLQSKDWWKDAPGGGLNTTIFVKEGFFCAQSKFIADVELPHDNKFAGFEATLVTGAAKAKQVTMKPLPGSLLDIPRPPAPVLSSHLPSRNTRRNLTRTLCLLRSTALPHQPDLLLIRLPFR